MTTFNHCRYCDDWKDQNMIRFSTRHYAHPKCWLEKGRSLAELPWHQIERMPFLLLKRNGLLEEADRLIKAKNTPMTKRHARIQKILQASNA